MIRMNYSDQFEMLDLTEEWLNQAAVDWQDMPASDVAMLECFRDFWDSLPGPSPTYLLYPDRVQFDKFRRSVTAG